MSDQAALDAALAPILEVVRGIDPSDGDARADLATRLPFDGELVQRLQHLVREGVEAGWLASRDAKGLRAAWRRHDEM